MADVVRVQPCDGGWQVEVDGRTLLLFDAGRSRDRRASDRTDGEAGIRALRHGRRCSGSRLLWRLDGRPTSD